MLFSIAQMKAENVLGPVQTLSTSSADAGSCDSSIIVRCIPVGPAMGCNLPKAACGADLLLKHK